MLTKSFLYLRVSGNLTDTHEDRRYPKQFYRRVQNLVQNRISYVVELADARKTY